jgi:hypothetical protein
MAEQSREEKPGIMAAAEVWGDPELWEALKATQVSDSPTWDQRTWDWLHRPRAERVAALEAAGYSAALPPSGFSQAEGRLLRQEALEQSQHVEAMRRQEPQRRGAVIRDALGLLRLGEWIAIGDHYDGRKFSHHGEVEPQRWDSWRSGYGERIIFGGGRIVERLWVCRAEDTCAGNNPALSRPVYALEQPAPAAGGKASAGPTPPKRKAGSLGGTKKEIHDQIRPIARVVYAETPDSPPNITEAETEIRQRMKGATRKHIRAVLAEPEFAEKRLPSGTPKRG